MSLDTLADPSLLSGRDLPRDPDWWRGGVIYQIYPRSFQDTNVDGIGDLAGITQRLPYVASLGVDAIWLSPFFPSPMADFGYDVANFTDVDPMFGSLGDLDRLIQRAHELGLRVMIDQVISHSSDRHPWFVESRSSHDNPRADWYVWADAKPDGTAPNNWLSIFGGSAWEWDTNRCQYYLHNFLASQPDLNFHNPEVQDAVLATVDFWLQRGVDGFRLDTVNFYFHSKGLEDNPALEPERRNALMAPAVNPYNHQNHVYSKSQPENLVFLGRLRELLDSYPDRAAVGEVGDALRGPELVGQYTAGRTGIHMCYSFDFLGPDPLDPGRVKRIVEEFYEAAPDGWSCWAFSNHDVQRHASRFGDIHYAQRDTLLRMLAVLLLTLRGSVSLYQGEELGFDEAEVPFESLQDPYGIKFWPAFKGRDGCRTPMVWSHHAPHGGFSTAEPWLPVASSHVDRAVSIQDHERDSLLSFYRAVLALRKETRSLVKGEITFHQCDENVLAFIRHTADERVLVIVNMSPETAPFTVPAGEWTALDLDGATPIEAADDGGMPAFGYLIAKQR